jgi:hypothetical protein
LNSKHLVTEFGETVVFEDASDWVGIVTDPDTVSPEHLRLMFDRAAAAADRAVGLWLARNPVGADDQAIKTVTARDELHMFRMSVRAAAAAYARQLRKDGVTPERMLVLVKKAAGHPGPQRFGSRELTNDVVRWSIEAYFDD